MPTCIRVAGRGNSDGIRDDQHRAVRCRIRHGDGWRDGLHRTGTGMEPTAPGYAASPAAYIVIKMLTSLTLAAGAVGAVYLVGAATNQASMPTYLWVITGICVWIGSLLFSALGLFIGYLLPSENVTQIISLVLMLCALPAASSFRSAISRALTPPWRSSRLCTGSTNSCTTPWSGATSIGCGC